MIIWRPFSYFSSKTYVVGTQKNRLNETVLLSTQNTCVQLIGKKIITVLGSLNFLIWIYDQESTIIEMKFN